MRKLAYAGLFALIATCGGSAESAKSPVARIFQSSENFGKLPDGRETRVFLLTNKNGLKARVSDFGATLVSMEVPDKNGNFADITPGFDSVEGYNRPGNPYFGGSVGRFGGRIALGRFTLDGQDYTLATNSSPNHIHGGKIGFNKRLWNVEASTPHSITFQYVSPNGEEGYPGTLTVHVTYTLSDDDELKWEATATTDAVTILNLVHHPYWNLSGDPTTSINDHLLTLFADKYLTADAQSTPTGELAPVAGTPMDFTQATPIGEQVIANFPPLKLGYDHAWILTSPEPNGLAAVARLKDPQTGRVLEIASNQLSVQFYGGYFLNGTVIGKGGTRYARESALCLETQGYPNAPNQPHFPSTVLKPGETYRHRMVYKFSAEKE